MSTTTTDDFLAQKYQNEIAMAQEKVRLLLRPTRKTQSKWFRDMCLMACAQLLHEKEKDTPKHHADSLKHFKAMYQQRKRVMATRAFLQKMAYYASKYMMEKKEEEEEPTLLLD